MAFSPGQQHRTGDHVRMLNILTVAKEVALKGLSTKDLEAIEAVYCSTPGTELHTRFQEVLKRGRECGDWEPRVDGLPLTEQHQLKLAAKHRSIMEGKFADGLSALRLKRASRSRS